MVRYMGPFITIYVYCNMAGCETWSLILREEEIDDVREQAAEENVLIQERRSTVQRYIMHT
jgi:hypothetical protein